MRIDPCKQCGAFDFYVKGKFSYCRPCHSEAQKRYVQNKRTGTTISRKPLKSKPLSTLLTKKKIKAPKSHCAQGHPFSGDNVRLEFTGTRLRRCRACERNAKRVTYGLAPEPAPTRLSELLGE